jgi:Bacterial pre-peptidase C-terminal domain
LRDAPIRRSILCAVAIGLAWQSSVRAKPPTLNTLFPAGAQRGQTVEVTAGGEFDLWPPRVWADQPGIEIQPSPEKGKLAITVTPAAHIGVAWLRLYNEDGASGPRPFIVGTLRELDETEPNDYAKHPQMLPAAKVTVNAKLARAGDVDCFGVSLRRGQTLVAAVEANGHLGSPMDSVLQVVSSQGYVLAQSDDDRGLDPSLAFEAPSDGLYVLRTFAFPATPDQTIAFAGGGTFIYRLTVTTGGFVDHPYPLAAECTRPTQLELYGWNIPESSRFFTFAANDASSMLQVELPMLANSAEVQIVPHAAIVEQEPNDPEHPQPITLPVTITGCVDPERDRDVFQFSARKDQKILVRVESRSLGLPLDPVLRVTDGSGKVLSDVDDTAGARDPELSFSAPADGDYRLWVRDLNGRGGFRYVYRLTLAAPEPDFSLSAAIDRVSLSPEKPGSIPVVIDRKNGFAGPISIRADGLPDGMTAEAVTSSPTGDKAKKVTIKLAASKAPTSGAFRIVGTSEGDRPIQHRASVLITGLVNPPSDLWATGVKEK